MILKENFYFHTAPFFNTGSVSRVVSEVAKKGSQVLGGGVIIDLSQSPLTPESLGNILSRVQNVTSQISHIRVVP